MKKREDVKIADSDSAPSETPKTLNFLLFILKETPVIKELKNQ